MAGLARALTQAGRLTNAQADTLQKKAVAQLVSELQVLGQETELPSQR